MKPKRYPYTGNKKEPINLMVDPKDFSRLIREAIHDTSQEAQE